MRLVRGRHLPTLLAAWLVAALTALALSACGDEGGSPAAPGTTTVPPLRIRSEDFPPLRDMTPVRGFFVTNLRGDLDATLAVARSAEGGTYPVGTLIQLVPQEAMVKREPGFSPATGDWEFFELDVSSGGTEIRVRGPEAVNRFGGSCADCHAQADPRFDFVCEQDHGCDPLPVGRPLIEAIQDADPRPS
jgi:hypothetical protein